MTPLRAFLASLRPLEWSKNLFVFTGLVFAYRFHDRVACWRATLAFAAFCGLSGMAYVFNDLCDRERDRQHPRKRLRPIASGQLDAKQITVGLALVAAWVTIVTVPLGRTFACWALGYFALNVAYSLWLKRIIFVDVLCVASGFLIRVFAGCAAVEVPASGYAVACAFSLALLIGAGKRRAELLAHGGESPLHRAVFDHYTPRMLDLTLGVAVTATVASYVWFVALSHKHPAALIVTLVFVGLGIWRYLRLLYQGRGADQPAQLMWEDWPLLLLCVAWVIATVAILWAGGAGRQL